MTIYEFVTNKYGIQHNKITENLVEFQKFIDSDSKTGIFLEDIIKFYDIQPPKTLAAVGEGHEGRLFLFSA